jgi:allophanate hydrolase subunit 2
LQQRRFFSHKYTVSERCDRMGYRLEGPAITCDIEGILSEGICFGAIQIPADGQPIVLLNDRQTIGGYPKIGSALSLDAAQLAQLTPGGSVHFAPISPHGAHNALHLARSFDQRQPLLERRP